MKTLRRYLATEIVAATALVFAALVMLFAFFDLIEQLKDLGRGIYTLRLILLYVLMLVPVHLYELFPIAALIGALFALAQLVAGSEYTVMRTSGVSTARFAATLAVIGLALAMLAFAFGELISPAAEQFAQRLRSQAITGLVAQEFRSGLWVKDDKTVVNVGEVLPDSSLKAVKIYEFDDRHRLLSISLAAVGSYQGERRWRLEKVSRTDFEDMKTTVREIAQIEWESVLDPNLLTVIMQKPEKMSAWRLYSYAQHLRDNRQKTLRYEIALWAKFTHPLAVVVMMVMALPFAHFQARQAGIGAKIFAGIMLGLVFHFMSKLFSHLGLLNDWPPVAAAIIPTLIFLSVAVGMLWWQERR
ncbi:MAG TPA: LPS export ABC transporter permease LptG [Burkholderiales bacterium]|jgi:lipopolysaccharide export system permease protein|nr:LPS export ABC transporter permease LptG [Burkholderiales bacterium]